MTFGEISFISNILDCEKLSLNKFETRKELGILNVKQLVVGARNRTYLIPIPCSESIPRSTCDVSIILFG